MKRDPVNPTHVALVMREIPEADPPMAFGQVS